jgi:transposase
MARQSKIKVKEDLEFLQNFYRKEKNHRIRARIKCLIYMKDKSLPSQLELSKHIGVDYATVKRWLKQYKEEGFDSLVVLKSGGNRRSVIDPQLHESLSAKLNDSNNPLLGYWDGVLWIKAHHGIDIKYNTLRTYLIRHFHTKLKSPRKSHYKKDEQAIEAFKKTT